MKSRVATLCVALLLIGCQASPLFNHTSRPVGRPPAEDPNGSVSECPLSFTRTDLCAELAWISYPKGDNGGVLSLKFWPKTQGTKNGPYIEPSAEVSAFLWMPEHGHGSSPIEIEKAAGQYELREVYFIMPGRWDFHIQLKSGGKLIDESTMVYVAN
jgi:hypothetical protein